MNEKNWREWLFIILMGGHIIITILILIAMLFYAGGTSTNPGAPGFSLWGNLIIDLGRTKAYSGKSNTVSSLIYSISLIMFGILIVPAAIVIPYFFKEDTKFDKWLSYIGSFFLIIVGILLIVRAFRPPDIYENVAFNGIAFLASIIQLISWSIIGLHSKSYPKKYGCLWIIILVNTFIQVFIMSIFAVSLAFWWFIYSGLRIILMYGFIKQSKSLTL